MLYSTRRPMVKEKMRQPVEIFNLSPETLYITMLHGPWRRTHRKGCRFFDPLNRCFRLWVIIHRNVAFSTTPQKAERQNRHGLRLVPLYSNDPKAKPPLTWLLRFFLYRRRLISYIAQCALKSRLSVRLRPTGCRLPSRFAATIVWKNKHAWKSPQRNARLQAHSARHP